MAVVCKRTAPQRVVTGIGTALIAVTLGGLLAWPGAAQAQDTAPTDPTDPTGLDLTNPAAMSVADRLDLLEGENRTLKRKLNTLERWRFDLEEGQGVPATPNGPTVASGEGEGEGAATSSTIRDRAKRDMERLGTKYGIYSKPFLVDVQDRLHLGGYIDLEFVDQQGENQRFDQRRFIPFFYADVTDSIKVAAELEFEHGGEEVAIEFATIDLQVSEAFSFRAGAILVPLGKFNLIHDSPVNDLTERPLVDRVIIPTTFTEAGAGIFGTFYFGEARLDYEAYLVNGFDGLGDGVSNFDDKKGLRGGRGSLQVDNNNNVAGVGRITLSPLLGTEFGASAHVGRYDDANDNLLLIYALDWTLQLGILADALAGVELQGEFARAEIARDTAARAAGVPDDMWGIYGQMNVHFFFDGLIDVLPSVFSNESTFTAVARFGHVELASNRLERLTLGFNIRPVEDAAIKVEYQFNFEDWSRREIDNDAVLLSFTTYF